MKVRIGSSAVPVVLLLSAVCVSQLPSSRCDTSHTALEDCTSVTQLEPMRAQILTSRKSFPVGGALPTESFEVTTTDDKPTSGEAPTAPVSSRSERFHWRQALAESFTFLIIEQGYVVKDDFHWVVSENGIPFNHYWRDYMQSLTSWWHAGWSAGENPLYNYVGHPIQGALTGYIWVQNDPKSEKLEFSNTKAYWISRLKATAWNAVYSTQWSMGPLSEMTVEKYGTKDRPPWNADGSYPCNTNKCYSGVGKVNIVMTPVGGLGWMVGEDWLDKNVAKRVEARTDNHLLIDTVRCALNPIRGGANILHGKVPWYRASRDAQGMSLVSDQKSAVSASQIPKTQAPSRGDLFFGYSYLGLAHCQEVSSGAKNICNPLSAKASDLSGWNLSLEKKDLRYFGAVADFSGQYGGVSVSNFLFGLRGGAWIGKLRPFAQVLFGAVYTRDNGSATSESDTTFAEDLGFGVDFRLMRLLSWRVQSDYIKTGSSDFERFNVRVSSGLAVRF